MAFWIDRSMRIETQINDLFHLILWNALVALQRRDEIHLFLLWNHMPSRTKYLPVSSSLYWIHIHNHKSIIQCMKQLENPPCFFKWFTARVKKQTKTKSGIPLEPLKYLLITLNNFIHDSFMNVFWKVMHALYIGFFCCCFTEDRT